MVGGETYIKGGDGTISKVCIGATRTMALHVSKG
jgi:hypothetical protein